ncbi:MAG: helix-turn-helix domain-containing protein [Chitinivibrionales bacterium]|nr:helix-turn-helix domain-containing protein [Chitinivibrionales bacterium]
MAIKNYTFNAGYPIEIELIPSMAAFLKKSSRVLCNPHRTDFYQILWFQHGCATHVVDFKPIKMEANSLLFINKHKVHMFDNSPDYNGKMVLFTDAFFCRTECDRMFLKSSSLFNDVFDSTGITLDATATSRFTSIFEQMETELQYPRDQFQYHILQNLLHNLLMLADRQRSSLGTVTISPSADLDYTLLYKDLVDAQFKRLKTVGDYAKNMNVTEKRLNNATKKTIGKTPKEMIDERILVEAKRLLVHTRNSIKEIGFELGFEEPTNFIKYFRKHTGKTPIDFRQFYLSKL